MKKTMMIFLSLGVFYFVHYSPLQPAFAEEQEELALKPQVRTWRDCGEYRKHLRYTAATAVITAAISAITTAITATVAAKRPWSDAATNCAP